MPIRSARGRRPGTSDTKAAILAAARAAFAAGGYDGVALRDIARAAGVDAALIHHYFGTKRALFDAVVDVGDDAAARGVAHPEAPAGERVVRAFLERWEAPGGAAALATLVRTAGSDARAQASLAELIARTVVVPATSLIDGTARMPKMRASLVGAQLVGLAWARYVARIEPLASASASLVARTYAPAIEALLGDEGRRR